MALADTAQMAMDLYYQDYKTDENFFSLRHFMYLCGVAYSKILEDEFKQARKEAKMEEGYTDVYLQNDWLVKDTITMKPSDIGNNVYEGALKRPLFTFPFDPYSFGVQSVRPSGKTSCRDFVRSTERESWMDCIMPVTSRGFFYVAAGKLVIKNSRCKLDSVDIMIVPEISDIAYGKDGGPVPKSKEDDIIRKTLDLMLRARDGVIVDMSNNSNPNKALQTEVDNTFQNLRTKPV